MTLKKSQSSDPEADTLVLGLGDGWDRPPVLWTAHDHQSRVAPARGLPSEALAKGGGKAELDHLGHKEDED